MDNKENLLEGPPDTPTLELVGSVGKLLGDSDAQERPARVGGEAGHDVSVFTQICYVHLGRDEKGDGEMGGGLKWVKMGEAVEMN